MTALRVRDLMTSTVYSLMPRDDLYAAQNLMDEHNVRHVPVVDDEQDLIGLITMRDLLRAANPGDEELPLEMVEAHKHAVNVSELMTEEVATVSPDDNLQETAQLMLDNKFGCVPVVQGSRLTGILTEADFVRYFARD